MNGPKVRERSVFFSQEIHLIVPDFKGSYGIPVFYEIIGRLPGASANLQKPRAVGKLCKDNYVLKQAFGIAGSGKVVIGDDVVKYFAVHSILLYIPPTPKAGRYSFVSSGRSAGEVENFPIS